MQYVWRDGTPVRLLLCGLCVMALALTATAAEHTPSRVRLINTTQAIVLGVVEGVTEYLPVSSTGHLLLAQRLMGITGNPAAPDLEAQRQAIDAYTVIIQFGAILAILLLYFNRVRQVFAGVVGKDPAGLRLCANLLIAFVPAVIIGYPVEKLVLGQLFNRWGIWPTVAAWLVGGLAIILVGRRQRAQGAEAMLSPDPLERLTWQQALLIGLIQCIAMWPGISRSLATIVGGLAVGMSMAAAVEFSFLLGLITLSAATFYELRHYHLIEQYLGVTSPLIGMVFAGIAAVVAVKWMVGYLNTHGLALFGYYRVALGVLVIALVAMKWLT